MDIQTVKDRMEIADLLGLYCRGIDRMDEATLRSIYHADAIEDRGEGLFVGNAQEWVGWTLSLLPAFAFTQHCIMNVLIDIDGDIAFGETYFQAYHRFATRKDEPRDVPTTREPGSGGIAWPDGETEMILAGRYLDRFERRGGMWKIAYRKMINDWSRSQPVADTWLRENPTAYRSSRTIADARLTTR